MCDCVRAFRAKAATAFNGGNLEPFPVGATPIEGKPETGDGLDGELRGAAEAGASPITIGQDAVGLLGGL